MAKLAHTVVISMPVFNEAEGICEFLEEIDSAFSGCARHFIVIDDCSTDQTPQALESWQESSSNTTVIRNIENLGHGPTTLCGLAAALEIDADFVITTDGDGQIQGQDLRRLFEIVKDNREGYGEGVRTGRSDPWFRELVSVATRGLVLLKSGMRPNDANTPFRVYTPETLRQVLRHVPPATATPNLYISAEARRLWGSVIEVPVRSLPRRGSNVQGSTWGRGRSLVPGMRFVQFCLRALVQWFTTSKVRT